MCPFVSGDFTRFADNNDSDDDFDDDGPKPVKRSHKKGGGIGGGSGGNKKKREKECPGCGAYLATSMKECPNCDYVFTSKSMLSAQSSAVEESQSIRDRFPFEPEREEDGSLLIEKVLGRRPRKTDRRWVVRAEINALTLADMSAMDGKYDHEYLIKYKSMSYLHVAWLSAAEIEAMNLKAKQALNRYLANLDRGNPGTPEDADMDPTWTEVERVLDMREEEVTELVDEGLAAAPPPVLRGTVSMRHIILSFTIYESVFCFLFSRPFIDSLNGGHGLDGFVSYSQGDADNDEDVIDLGTTSTAAVIANPIRQTFASQSSAATVARNSSRTSLGGGDKDDDEDEAEQETTVASKYCALDRCRKVLERLWDDPFAVSFIEPVDTDQYDDYLDVVEQGTIIHLLIPTFYDYV